MRPILILENIRSAYNVGTMIRTADALGRDVICGGFTAHPATQPKVKKTSLGAEEHVEILSFSETGAAIDSVKEKGYTVIASEMTTTSIGLDHTDDLHLQHPLALIMGNEITGISPTTLALCDHIIHIPMQGVKESLNVAEAAAIMMRELGKR